MCLLLLPWAPSPRDPRVHLRKVAGNSCQAFLSTAGMCWRSSLLVGRLPCSIRPESWARESQASAKQRWGPWRVSWKAPGPKEET